MSNPKRGNDFSAKANRARVVDPGLRSTSLTATPQRRRTSASPGSSRRPEGFATEAEAKLQAVNVLLRREIAAREREEKEHAKCEHALRDHQARFKAAFGTTPIGMSLIDMEGRWLEVNDALCRITGYSRAQLVATTLEAITQPEDVELDAQQMRDLLAGEISSYQVEKRYRHAWDHYFWVLVTTSLVSDDRNRALYVISQVQDISERKELARRLEHLIDHDFLTGLLNGRRFEAEVAEELQRATRYGSGGAVLMIDLDNFKEVNDAFGHLAGDDLLRGVTGALRHRIRQTDILARVGGDEFAVLLPQTDAEQARVVADLIVKALHRHVAMLDGKSVRTTVSVGVAMLEGPDAQSVLANADRAMYEAKAAGRDRFAIHHPGPGQVERPSMRLATAERIRGALEEDRLLLYCQPIFDLKEKEVSQYELLLRLPDDQGGEPILPGAFLYVAERSGLIQAIDCWVVRKAIALIDEHRRAGRRLVLHVNLSGKSIGDPKVTASIEAALAETVIDPACLVFELTETAAISNIEEAKAFTHRLRARGCRFALDDFGAGFGSFFYLKALPFDFLKIDGEFIRGVLASPMDRVVVEAIVSIAKGTGKKTIAEFVGDEDTSRLLEECGVDYAQGYHVSRPKPLAEILTLA
jgi:diguanylate cyclase (GGDEF)-like protein/PAS domain S-box-containing protein